MAIYCGGCGKKLIITNIKSNGYDTYSGLELYKGRQKCPNKKWIFDKHDSWNIEFKSKEDIEYSKQYDHVP